MNTLECREGLQVLSMPKVHTQEMKVQAVAGESLSTMKLVISHLKILSQPVEMATNTEVV